MPRISAFYGIVIRMYWRDHQPPHFHAEYGDDEAWFLIDPHRLLRGKLPLRQLRLVEEWAALHQAELLDDWERAQARVPLVEIQPLSL